MVSVETSASSGVAQMSKLTIVKNLVMVCACFLLCFTGFMGTRSLQSSLNTEDNLGNNSSAIIGLFSVISNLLLATLVLCKLGLKWSMVLSLLMYVTYPSSNFFPVWYVMYAGAGITGLSGGPLWNAKSVYLTQLGERYAELSGETPEVVISLFFGLFFMIYRGSLFTGNVISSIVIHRPPSTHIPSADDEVTIGLLCGKHYCYEDLDVAFRPDAINATNNIESSIYHPTIFQTNLLFGIYVVCALLAVPLAAIIDPMDISGNSKSMKVVDALLATMRHMKNPKEILLIPLSLLSGVSYAFMLADYCVGFVTCSIGVDNVGFVSSVFGASSALGSLILALLVKYIGRRAIFAIGGLCNAASLIGMFVWPLGSHSLTALCVLAGLWGFANAVWTSQLIPFIAVVFRNGPKEAAFSCNYLWQTGGISLWHFTSMYMCLYVQLYVIAAILTIGMAGYVVIELMLRAEEHKDADQEHRMDEVAPPPSSCTVGESIHAARHDIVVSR